MLSEHSKEENSLENQAGEKEKLSPDLVVEDMHESSALAVKKDDEQQSVELT